MINNEEIESLLKRYREQEDALKQKIRFWINNKGTFDFKKDDKNVAMNNTNTSTKIKSDNASNTNVNSDAIEITGSSENLIYKEKTQPLDFNSTVTIAQKVADGYKLVHMDINELKNLKENEDYVVLINWANVVPENPTINDVDFIFNKSFEELKVNINSKKELLGTLKEQNDDFHEKLLNEKKNNEQEVVTIQDLLNSYDDILDDKFESVANNENTDNKKTDNIKKDVFDDILQEDSNNTVTTTEREMPDDIARLLGFSDEEVINSVEDKDVAKPIEKEEVKKVEDKEPIKNNLYDELLNDLENEDIPTIGSLTKDELNNKLQQLSTRNDEIDKSLNHKSAINLRNDGTIFIGDDMISSIVDNTEFAKAVTLVGIEAIFNSMKQEDNLLTKENENTNNLVIDSNVSKDEDNTLDESGKIMNM